jgi:iron complex transport system ATP-binding protein
MLRTESLSYWIEDSLLLNDIEVSFEPNRFHVIMGANGAGKTTLLRLLAGNLQPSEGDVFLFDRSIKSYSKKELATKRAVLSQHYQIAFPMAANDIVMMGRYPFFSTAPSRTDRNICKETMRLMHSHELSNREYGSLSGGEAQKIQMSRVLAQIWEANPRNEKILFLDEPVSHLDLKYQHQLLETAKGLCKQNVTVIAILHDINLALLFADHILFLKEGKLIYDTLQPSKVDAEVIRNVFDVNASVIDLANGKRVVVF